MCVAYFDVHRGDTMPAHHDLQSESEEDKQATLLAAIEDPSAVAARLHQFRDTAQILSSQHELTAQYAKQWVALYQGKVVASGVEVQTVLQGLEEQQIPSVDARC